MNYLKIYTKHILNQILLFEYKKRLMPKCELFYQILILNTNKAIW
jgi:hypothetical protein